MDNLLKKTALEQLAILLNGENTRDTGVVQTR